MNIKKSKIYEMIKEELEVILTNDEAHEIFDLDAGALLDAMMKEAIGRTFGCPSTRRHRQ